MKKTPVVIQGISYPSIRDACRVLGKEDIYDKILNRIKYGGWSLEEAFELNDRQRGEPITYKGVKYKNLRDLCEKTGIKYGTVRQGVRRGKRIEDYLN